MSISKHDRALRSKVQYHKKRGAKVWADLEGEKKPKTINGKRPDYRAQYSNREIVGEVETSVSMKTDQKQRERLKKALDGKSNVVFKVWNVDNRKRKKNKRRN